MSYLPKLTLPFRSATRYANATPTLFIAPIYRLHCSLLLSRRTSTRRLPLAVRPNFLHNPNHAAATMTSIANNDIARDAGLENTDTITLENYTFPKERLKKVLSNDKKQPLVLVSCGSFSPPTNLHLRMFEEATDYCEFETDFEVVGGFFSPVGDAYKKAGLASAHHRISMTRIAVKDSSTWIGVDPWEPLHKEYMPTVKVLDHFDHELNEVLGGIETSTGEKKRIHVALLAGADLIQTMSTPGLWAREDLSRILGVYGAFILERSGTDIGMLHPVKFKHIYANLHQMMPLLACNSGKTTSVLFLSSSRTMSLLQRFACSASAARASDTTSRTRLLTTSTSTACMLLTTRSRRLPKRGKRRPPTVQLVRLHSHRLERSCVLQRATPARPASHATAADLSICTTSSDQDCRADHGNSLFLQGIMISFWAAVVGEPYTTGLSF